MILFPFLLRGDVEVNFENFLGKIFLYRLRYMYLFLRSSKTVSKK